MRVQTMSIVIGGSACNARCPYCISKTTPSVPKTMCQINWRNFHKACNLAHMCGATTVLLTGKGEPTLYPGEITKYLTELKSKPFPFIELQTNGIILENCTANIDLQNDLECWYSMGLNTICISIASYNDRKNHEIYHWNGDGKGSPAKPMDIQKVIANLKAFGFHIRITCMLIHGYIDNWDQVCNLLSFCKENEVDQLTIRPIEAPTNSDSDEAKWAREHRPPQVHLDQIQNRLEKDATRILSLSHGATVYDYRGQNICLSNCITTNHGEDDIRQIIFHSSGKLYYDWKYTGANLL